MTPFVLARYLTWRFLLSCGAVAAALAAFVFIINLAELLNRSAGKDEMTFGIALAISVVTSRLGQAPTLIFDEVDSGIGGAVAHTVGQLLRQLGQDRQVLAVTHLPQVAACGDHHLLVSKRQSGTTTHSTVTPIAQEDRVRELARMLGGNERSEVSLAHARELLTA